jgi:nucleotide-binding universal stress UspA family protein
MSHGSAESLRYGLALARAYRAELYLCHCIESATAADSRSPSSTRHIQAALEAMFNEQAGGDDLAEVEWKAMVVEGSAHPSEMISRVAAENGVDLIVIRSRRRPRAAALLGSTAEALCRTAPCPVLVTHPREREWVGESAREINLRKVLVAYDFSDDSELALRRGLSLAQEYGAELHLLHVLAKPSDDAPEVAWLPAGMEGIYQKAARRLQEAVSAEFSPPESGTVKCAVRWGKPYREILSYAVEQEFDLICMGAHGAEHGMSALFGSNVDRVLRQAPCPLLVARPLKPATFVRHDTKTTSGKAGVGQRVAACRVRRSELSLVAGRVRSRNTRFGFLKSGNRRRDAVRRAGSGVVR